MSESPYRSGDFVWSAYPTREHPTRPGPRHLGYVAASIETGPVNAVFLAYTTSRPWTGRRPFGLYTFDHDAAAEMGQTRPFTLDLRRIAAVPVTVRWFPDLNGPNHGKIGQASEKLRVTLETATKQLFSRHPGNVERLGPLWPR